MAIFKNEIEQFGIDIGNTGMRVVQVRPGRSAPELVTYGAVAMDPKVMQSDSDVDTQRITEAIKKLVHDSKISVKNVVAGLPSTKVYASVVNLPKMSGQELAKSIKYQAEQYIPIPLDEAKLDWAVLSEGGEQDQEMEVLLVAAPVKITERYLNMLEGAGLEVIALEPDASALARSLVSATNLAVVVLDVGARSTDLVTVYNGTTQLIRSIPVGGETFVRAAAQNLGLEDKQAMEFVYKFGMTQSKLEGQVKRAIESSVDNLIGELDKSNKFFLSKHKDVKIEKVVITGQGSVLPEFPTYLANKVGLPVEIGSPWSRISVNATMRDQVMQYSNQFAVAAGLALREMV